MGVSSNKALTGLRVSVGILFLIFGEYKVFGTQFTLGGGFQYWIERFLQEGAYPFMVPILKDFVLPHSVPIAFLVAYGELAIGIALVLGILIRPASICGLTYMLSLLFSANYPGPHAVFWQYFGASLEHLVLALCFTAFASTNPKEMLSIRTYLRGRRSAGWRLIPSTRQHSASSSCLVESMRSPAGTSKQHSGSHGMRWKGDSLSGVWVPAKGNAILKE